MDLGGVFHPQVRGHKRSLTLASVTGLTSAVVSLDGRCSDHKSEVTNDVALMRYLFYAAKEISIFKCGVVDSFWRKGYTSCFRKTWSLLI